MVQRTGGGLLLAAACVVAAIVASTGAAGRSDDLRLTGVAAANTKSAGVAPASLLARGLQQAVVAQGANKVENPSAAVSTYGYDNDVLAASGDPQMLPTTTSNTEAQKTEPDNVTFLSRDEVTFVQDMGDTLHTQSNALDSAFVWNVRLDYSNPSNQPVRWLAEGRDASATIDSANGGFGKNDQDNEITGVHVSDGDPGPNGILGAREPQLFDDGWRWFYTQQHGENFTFEVIPN
jgi:hypothetical protein